MNVNQQYFGNADTVASTLMWNGPICSTCGKGYLDAHVCPLVPIPCPDGRDGCAVMHYGHRDAAPAGASMPTTNVYTLRFPSLEPLEPEVRAMLVDALVETVRDALDDTAADLAVAVEHQEVE